MSEGVIFRRHMYLRCFEYLRGSGLQGGSRMKKGIILGNIVRQDTMQRRYFCYTADAGIHSRVHDGWCASDWVMMLGMGAWVKIDSIQGTSGCQHVCYFPSSSATDAWISRGQWRVLCLRESHNFRGGRMGFMRKETASVAVLRVRICVKA